MSRFVLTAQLQLQAPNNVAQVVNQIQSQLNGVNVNLNVQGSARAQRQLQQITSQTQAATSAADRMGRAFAVSIRRFAAFSIATRAVGLFTSTLSSAIQTSIDFERQMIKISQVTGDSMEKLKGLTKTITDLSTGFGVTSQSLLEASTLLLQAGISAKDTEIALKTLAKAALAPNFDSLSETTEGAIAILAQFGQGVDALEGQLGSINAVAGAFAVEASDLMDVIRRTGGVFKASGGSLNELIALFTSVRATTRESAESIGTGLRTIFTRIQRPKTIEFLKQFGVELVDMEGKFVGPYEAVKRLSSALAGLGERDITFIRIAEELGGFRQIGKVLPLLQQFTTAQNALNVANKAGNSLTNDAATAQQALAIRILKVKEEFLALVRGMTETKTFQIMANTALSLASALIKMADAIKPLLPMLTALMAFRLARGVGSFLGGIGRGISSGRTFSTGGKVHHFARGGVVPGVGNRDTVPAMLQPGEFVIKKSSVNSIGAGNLAAMNENKFAAGGKVGSNRSLYGPKTPWQTIQRQYPNLSERQAQAVANGTKTIGYYQSRGILDKPQTKTTKKQAEKLAKERKSLLDKYPGGAFTTRPGAIGGFFLTPERGNDGQYSLPTTKEFMLNNQKAALLSGSKINNYVPFRNDLKSNSQLTSIIDNSAKLGVKNAVVNSADQVASFLNLPSIQLDRRNIKSAANKVASDKQVFSTIGGYMYEGIIQGITGAKLAGGQTSFDYPILGQAEKSKLGTLFGSNASIAGLIKADAKRSLNSKMNDSIFDKVVNGIIGGDMRGVKRLGEISTDKIGRSRKSKMQRIGMATGGGVGTDTVPALLTPGEFVVNRSSAQSIGYGNLNRMNKVGKYASGGIVQRFAAGTTGTGARPRGDFVVNTLVDTSGLYGSILKAAAALDKFTLGGLGKLSAGLEFLGAKITGSATSSDRYKVGITYLNSVIPNFGKIIEDNQKATKRSIFTQIDLVQTMAHNVSNLQKSGASQTQVHNAAQRYANILQQQTTLLQKGAPLPAMAAPPPPTPTGPSGPTTRTRTTRSSTAGGNRNVVGMVQDNKMMAASIATSLVQGFLPAINENSGAALRLTHSFLGLVTTITSVGFALEAFGIKLGKGGLMDFLSGKGNLGNKLTEKIGLNRRAIAQQANFLTPANATGAQRFGALRQAVQQSRAGFAFTGQGVGGFTASLGKITQGFVKLAGPLTAIIGSSYIITKAFGSAIEAIYNFDGRLKSAIETGDVEKAQQVAGERASFQGANVIRGGGATAGAVIGMIFGGPIGAAIGATLGAGIATLVTSSISNIFGEAGDRFLAGVGTLFGGATYDSAVALAAAQAGAVKTQKELDKAQKVATTAMEDFANGSISASEALSRIRVATQETVNQEKRASDFAIKNLENRAGGASGVGRNIMSFLSFGAVESSSQRNQRLGKESAEQIRQAAKFQAEAFQMESPARSAMIRSGFARGKSKEEIRNEALGVGTKNDKLARLQQLSNTARTLGNKGDTEGAKAASEAFDQLKEEINQVDREMVNLEKEIGRAKAAFEAMNLGLRGATATSTAMSASMDKFAAGLEVGGSSFVANTEFLSQAVTSAAQAMDPAEIKSAVDNVGKNLSQMGVSSTYVNKFKTNTQAFVQAQQNYNKAFENIKERIGKDFTGMDADTLKKEFAKELTAGLGEDAKKNLTAIIENMQLSDDEVDAILGGNLQAFGDKLSEAGQKQFEEIMKIAQERQKAEQVVIGLIQKRADAERNLASAQKEAMDLYMEGRDIQAKYGGAPVSYAEKRGAILAKANFGAANAGLGAMRTGNIGELRNRNAQIMAGFANIEAKRSIEGGMEGTAGVKDEQTQQNLQQAQKDQIQTIKDLIKLEEEELKIIQEKNKMERESLDALIGGDVEKFFEQQAAIGAQAAIAAGDKNAANMFGQKAVGMAFQDIQRQQEAGVQSMFGRQLGGPGGLAEQAAGAALASRGVMDPRMAQRLAGTTAAEEASKARLRELGGMLGETGAAGVAMAEMQVQTANINVTNAELKLSEIEARGKKAAEGMYRGGMVYASRGIFVPRGTDTVPAMLTPGEFVVNRAAVNTGNNLQLLQAINNGGNTAGFSKGGKVGYYNSGGQVQYRATGGITNPSNSIGIDPQIITNLGNIFDKFVNGFNESIKNLKDTKLQVKLDSVNVNVNLNGTSMLTQISDEARSSIINQVVEKLKSQYGVGSNGKLQQNNSNLPRPGG